MATGLGLSAIFLTVWLSANAAQTTEREPIATVALAMALIAASIIDIESYRLPDLITLPLAIAGVLSGPWLGWSMLLHASAAVVGFLFLYAVSVAYRYLMQRDGLGLGDAKLLGGGAAWLGPESIASIVLLASVLALTLIICSMMMGRRYRMDDALPFGPFLALSIWIFWNHAPI